MGDMAAADKILAEVDKFLRTWRRDRLKSQNEGTKVESVS